jgi:hypothetical protein
MRTPTVFIPHGSYNSDPVRTFGLKGFLEFRNNLGGIGSEASPIYTSIKVTRSGSGTRSVTSGGITTTQTISYTKDQTFSRILLTDLSLDYDSRFQFSDGAYDQCFPSEAVPEDKTGFIHYVFGVDRAERYLSDPKRHYLLTPGNRGFDNFKYGTQVINSNPATDLLTTISINCPFFTYAEPFPIFPAVLPNEYDQWNCNIGIDPQGNQFGIDVTSYSATKWRDLRGTYTLSVDDSDLDSSWDSNSVSHTVEWIIS